MATARPIPQAAPDPRPALAGAPLPDRARSWLDTATARVAADPAAIRALFPAARRQCGQARLTDHWHTDEAVRAALLTALPLRGAALADAVAELYRHGDPAEQRAVLRALPLLEEVNEEADGEADGEVVAGGAANPGAGNGSSGGPNGLGDTGSSDNPGRSDDPDRSDDVDPRGLPTSSAAQAIPTTPVTPTPATRSPLTPTGIPGVRHTPFTPAPEDRLGDLTLSLVREALRGNDNSVIEAALGAYAAARLPDTEHRQAVLRCVFSDIPLNRLHGLDARADRELARMLADFAHERIAADRTVPADVWPLVRSHTALAKSLAARVRDLAGTCPEAAARALAALAGTEETMPFAMDTRTAPSATETVVATHFAGEPHRRP